MKERKIRKARRFAWIYYVIGDVFLMFF